MALEFKELVMATHNAGKVREIGELLKGHVEKIYSAGDLDLPEPVEDGDTFIANALIKARASATASGKPALADDSGLGVNALGGDPGIFSARWGGPEKDFDMAMEKVHDALGDAEDRSAYFICALALVMPNGEEHVFEGRVDGDIVWPMRGDHGFGYDAIFVPEGRTETFAEIDPTEKHAMSHRARAFQMLKDAFA